jgi:hypothetical protein
MCIWCCRHFFVKLMSTVRLVSCSWWCGERKEWIQGFKFPGQAPTPKVTQSFPWLLWKRPLCLRDAELSWLKIKSRISSHRRPSYNANWIPNLTGYYVLFKWGHWQEGFYLQTAFGRKWHHPLSPGLQACWPSLQISYLSAQNCMSQFLKINLCPFVSLPPPLPPTACNL